jgi:hypothetical protein
MGLRRIEPVTVAEIIRELDAEIARLEQAKTLLSNGRNPAGRNLTTALPGSGRGTAHKKARP